MAKIRQTPFKEQKKRMVAVRSFVRSGIRSHYLTIPVNLAEFLGWTEEDYFKVTAEDGKIIIEKLVLDN